MKYFWVFLHGDSNHDISKRLIIPSYEKNWVLLRCQSAQQRIATTTWRCHQARQAAKVSTAYYISSLSEHQRQTIISVQGCLKAQWWFENQRSSQAANQSSQMPDQQLENIKYNKIQQEVPHKQSTQRQNARWNNHSLQAQPPFQRLWYVFLQSFKWSFLFWEHFLMKISVLGKFLIFPPTTEHSECPIQPPPRSTHHTWTNQVNII